MGRGGVSVSVGGVNIEVEKCRNESCLWSPARMRRSNTGPSLQTVFQQLLPALNPPWCVRSVRARPVGVTQPVPPAFPVSLRF